MMDLEPPPPQEVKADDPEYRNWVYRLWAKLDDTVRTRFFGESADDGAIIAAFRQAGRIRASASGGASTFLDGVFRVQNTTDPTKQFALNLANFTPATTNTFTLPNAGGRILTAFSTENVTNKTISSSSLNGSPVGNSIRDTGAFTTATAGTGTENVFFGLFAGNLGVTGIQNAYFGYSAGNANFDGRFNTSVGYRALATNSGSDYNTAIGHLALSSFSSSTGTIAQNTALGSSALINATSSLRNTALGASSQSGNTTGSENTAVGQLSLEENQGGVNNAAIGNSALRFGTNNSRNAALGAFAGQASGSGDDNVYLGYNAKGRSAGGGNNQVVIGSGAQARDSNDTVIGNSSTATFIIYGTNDFRQDDFGNTFLGAVTLAPFGATQVFCLSDQAGNPLNNPVGGGALYTVAGELRYKGSAGTVTTIALA